MMDLAELYGQCQFEPEQVAQMLEIKLDAFIGSELYQTYERGVLKAQVAVRRALLQKASDGDGAAQREFMRIALDLDGGDGNAG